MVHRTWTFILRTRLAFLGAALTFATACSTPGNEPVDTSREALFSNDKPAYDFFVSKGLTNFQAAAVVGNLDQESGVDPTISQYGGGPGRGIAQWSAGARWDTTPGDNLVAYAATQKMPTNSLTVQLGFIWYELETFPQYGLAKLRATTNVTDATAVFEDNFEGCVYANFPVCNLPQRVTFAKNVLAAFGNDPVPRDAGSTSDGAASVDAKMGDGAPTADTATSDSGGMTSNDAALGEATTSPTLPDAEPPATRDAEAPSKTSEAGTTSSYAEVDSGGCAVHSRGARSSGGYWLFAIGLALARRRRR
jgi:MYXO-CTERM domain-containing protein